MIYGIAVVLLPFIVDASYVSKKGHYFKKCHTEHEAVADHEEDCTTVYEQECSNVQEQQCSPKVEEVCNTVEVQECSTNYEQVCSQHQDRHCSTSHEQQCETVYEDECTADYEQQCYIEYEEDCSISGYGKKVMLLREFFIYFFILSNLSRRVILFPRNHVAKFPGRIVVRSLKKNATRGPRSAVLVFP